MNRDVDLQEAIETVAFLRGLEKDDKIVQSIVDGMQREDELFRTLPNLSIFGIGKLSILFYDFIN